MFRLWKAFLLKLHFKVLFWQTVIQSRLLSSCHFLQSHTVIVWRCQCQLHKLSMTDCTLLVGGQLMNGLHTLPHTRISGRLITVNAVYTLLRLLVFCKSLTQDRPTGLCLLLGSADKLAIKLKLMINLLEGMHFSDLRLHVRDVGTFEIQAESQLSGRKVTFSCCFQRG